MDERGSSALTRLVSIPGLVALAILGVAFIILARLFGPENILREVLTEVIASFGSTVLVLAIFGLLFRSGLERLMRGAPGGEALSKSAEQLRDVVEDLADEDTEGRGSGRDEQLDRIAEDLRSLIEDELPALKNEIAELRSELTSPERGSCDRDTGPG